MHGGPLGESLLANTLPRLNMRALACQASARYKPGAGRPAHPARSGRKLWRSGGAGTTRWRCRRPLTS
eukprot:5105862-Alexandrium_andersonii.AAC.1